MEEALVERLRASTGVAAAAGTVNGRPAVDWIERHSDAASAFPALTLQVIAPGRLYDLDGPAGLQQRLVQADTWGLSYAAAKTLARATIAELEQAKTVDDIRFHRGRLRTERDMPPEDLGSNMRVYRVNMDFIISTTA